MAKKANKKTTLPDTGPRPPGRPPFIETPEEFEEMVDAYVAVCTSKREPLTWSGLAYFLGYADRSGLDAAAKRKGFSLPVKRAKLLIEAAYEKRLSGATPTGAIFALKNFGWKDNHDLDVSLKVTPAGLFASAKKKEGAHGGDA